MLAQASSCRYGLDVAGWRGRSLDGRVVQGSGRTIHFVVANRRQLGPSHLGERDANAVAIASSQHNHRASVALESQIIPGHLPHADGHVSGAKS